MYEILHAGVEIFAAALDLEDAYNKVSFSLSVVSATGTQHPPN